MMKLSALKIGFGVSLLVHGTIFSVIYHVGHRPGNAAPPAAPEPSSMVEIVVDSDQPAAAIPATPQVVVSPKLEVTISESLPVKPVVAPPLPEPPKPAHEEKPELIPVALDWDTDPAGEPPVMANVKQIVATPSAGASSVNPSPAAGESVCNRPGYLSNPKPAYPAEARQRRQQGLVVLTVFITGEGRPQRVDVTQSSGHVLLDEAALGAVRQWQFTPARIGNLPIASQVEVPIRFKLSE